MKNHFVLEDNNFRYHPKEKYFEKAYTNLQD